MQRLSHWALQLAIILLLAISLPLLQEAASDGPKGASPGDITSLENAWSEWVPELMDEHEIEGAAIAILVDGEKVWSKSFGHADIESGTPLRLENLMMGHSISKSVTAWGLMKLVRDGRLDLDAPISNYLNDESLASSYPLDEITTRDLASMNAGIPLGTVGEHLEPGQKRPDLRARLTAHGMQRRPPRSGFEYSNLSYTFLELIIEEISGRDFGAYMDHEVLDPLGMTNSSFDWQPEFEDQVPSGYDIDGEPVHVYLYPGRASGGLFATLDDLTRFAAASIEHDESVLTNDEIAEMHRAHTPIGGLFSATADHYGLGHFIEELDGDIRAIWHGGQGLGWMTHFYVIPQTGDGIVIVSNSQKSWPFFARLLEEWSSWAGVPAPGMAVITRATLAMRILVSLLFFVAAWASGRIFWRIRRGEREFAFGKPAGTQFVFAAAAALVTIGLVWALTRDYLFITSIFPQETPLLFIALVVVASVLCLAALTRPVPDDPS